MSVSEIKAEIQKLTPEQKKELLAALEAAISAPEENEATTMAEYLGTLRGTAILKPGWDDDESVNDWNATR